MAENTKNLYQRVSAVMQDVMYLKKDDSVGTGNYAYKAISEEKVTETVRQSLIKNGLVILPVSQEHKLTDHTRPDRNGVMTIVPISTVDTKYKIVNIDNPSEFEILASSGTGVDPQDKGVGKAMTYSYKYLLLRTFAIPTGEDPDKVHNNELEKQQKPVPTKAQQKEQAATEVEEPQSLAVDLKPLQEEFIKLLNHDLINPIEKTKGISKVASLNKEQLEQQILKVKSLIRQRES